MKQVIAFSMFCFVMFSFSCKEVKNEGKDFTPSKQQKAEDAIKTWMYDNKEYPHYKPVVFGDITPRYAKSHRTLQLSIQIGEERTIAQETGNTEKLDSLNRIMEKYSGDLMGYLIAHKFQETNLAGETINRELLFFLDTTLRVASALNPESFDYILDEKVFFRLDSIEKEKELE